MRVIKQCILIFWKPSVGSLAAGIEGSAMIVMGVFYIAKIIRRDLKCGSYFEIQVTWTGPAWRLQLYEIVKNIRCQREEPSFLTIKCRKFWVTSVNNRKVLPLVIRRQNLTPDYVRQRRAALREQIADWVRRDGAASAIRDLRQALAINTSAMPVTQDLVYEFLKIEALLSLAVVHHEHANLSCENRQKLCDMAAKILSMLRIERGESNLDFLYDAIDLNQLIIFRESHRWDESLWFLACERSRSVVDNDTSKAIRSLYSSVIYARKGMYLKSASLLSDTLSDPVLSMEPSYFAQIADVAYSLHLMGFSGPWEELSRKTLERQLDLTTHQLEHINWLKLKAQSNLFFPDARFFLLHSKGSFGINSDLEMKLLGFIDPKPIRIQSFSKASTLARRCSQIPNHQKTAIEPIIRILKCLDDMYDRTIPLNSRISFCQDLLASRRELDFTEHEILATLAALRWAARFSQRELAATIHQEMIDRWGGDFERLNLPDEFYQSLAIGKTRKAEHRIVMATKLALNTASYAVKKTVKKAFHLTTDELQDAVEVDRLAVKVLESMGAMRGALMKVAQISAFVAKLPAPVQRAVEILQYGQQFDSAKLDQFTIEKILGRPIHEMFSNWCSEPIACGSVANVYRATTLDGQEVVVKIRDQATANALESDLSQRWLLSLIVRMILPAADAEGIASEVSSMILGELDLAKEAENLKFFSDFFADDPDIIIPKVYPSLSGRDYLTMDYIDGMKKSEFILEVDEFRRQRASNAIIRFYAKSFAIAGIMNCDPHPGNFIFKSDGRVAFVDFGSCRAWSKAMVEKIVEVLSAHMDGTVSRKIAAWEALGYGAGQPSFDFVAHVDEMDRVLLPIMLEPYEGGHGAFTFTKSYVEDMQTMQLQGLSNSKLLAPAPETTFMVRISFGMLDILADLQASGNYRQMLAEALAAKARKSA